MLAQLSARLRARQTAAGGEGGDGEAEEEGVPIMVDDNCSVGSSVRLRMPGIKLSVY